MDIFEQYFYDLNALNRIPGNDYTYSDQVDIIQEKIDIFEKYRQTVDMSAGSGVGILPASLQNRVSYILNVKVQTKF